MNPNNSKYLWPRAIMLVDLNAFFASIEQQDFPELRGKPVAVTNGDHGSCIITCSYEARRYGVHTGMPVYEARKICPDIIQRASRPRRYTEISAKIMQLLTHITPDIEIFSVDEAFLDVTHCQRLHGSPFEMAKMAKQLIFDHTGLYCSVGVSGDKTTAKYAAKLQKPNGLTVIHPSRAKDVLAKVPVTELCGIANGIGGFLAQQGVILCGDMINLPLTILKKRYGPLGERIWFMAQGLDPTIVKQYDQMPKSVGHGKVLPPKTTDKKTILIFFRHMAEKVATRLRKYNFEAKRFYIGIRIKDSKNKIEWIHTKPQLAIYDNDGLEIFKLCSLFIENNWYGEAVTHVQVTALAPQLIGEQSDLFTSSYCKKKNTNKVMDDINERYGKFMLQPATLLEKTTMPDVIAFNWNPNGIRDTIS